MVTDFEIGKKSLNNYLTWFLFCMCKNTIYSESLQVYNVWILFFFIIGLLSKKALKGRRLLAVGKTHRHHFKQNPLFQNKNATIQSFSTNYLLLIAEF